MKSGFCVHANKNRCKFVVQGLRDETNVVDMSVVQKDVIDLYEGGILFKSSFDTKLDEVK